MATATWIAPAHSSWNVDSNWSTGYVPTSSDDVRFTSSSIKNCTIDIDVFINSFTALTTYTGNIEASGYNLTCNLGFSDDGHGNRIYPGSLACSGTGSMVHFGSTLNTVIASSTTLTLSGGGMTLDCDKAITFLNLVLLESASITNTGAAQITFDAFFTPISLGDYASITFTTGMTAKMSGGGYLIYQGYASSLLGNGTLTFKIYDGSYYFSDYYHNGGGATFISPNSDGITADINLNGVFSSKGSLIVATTNASNLTFDTHGFNITTTTYSCGCNDAGGSFTAFYGSSNITLSSYVGDDYNLGSITQYFQSSVWVSRGEGAAWTHGSNHVIDEGNFIVTFYGLGTVAGQAVLITAGKPFYDLNLNFIPDYQGRPKRLSVIGDLICHNFNASRGALSFEYDTTSGLTVSGDLISTIAYPSAISVWNYITMTGATATLSMKSGISQTFPRLTMSGTDMQIVLSSNLQIGKLTLAAGTKVTATGTGHIIVTGSTSIAGYRPGATTLLILNDGSIFTCNYIGSLYLRPFASMSVLSIGAGVTWNGTSSIIIDLINSPSSLIIDLSAIVQYTGTGAWTLAPDKSGTISLGGLFDINSNDLTVSAGSSSSFLTNGNQIICGNFYIGHTSANSSTHYHFSNSTIDILSFSGTSEAYGGIQYFEDSQWFCDGNWTFGTTSHTVIPGLSSVTITNTSTVTPNGKSFYDFIVNASTKAVSVTGTLTCHTLHVIDGNYSQSGVSAYASGDILFDGVGTLNTGVGIHSEGSSQTIRLSSSVGVVTSSQTLLTIAGSLINAQIDKDATFKSLTLGSGNDTHLYGIGSVALINTATPLDIGFGVGLTIDRPLTVQMNATGSAILCQSSSLLDGTSNLIVHSTASGAVVSIQELNMEGALDFYLLNNSSSVSNTLQLTGNLNMTGNLFLNNMSTGTLSFKSNSSSISAGSISYGGSHASGTFNADFGTSLITTQSINPTQYDSGINTIKFNQSTSRLGGDCFFLPSHNNQHAWDSFIFFGDSTVTSNGKTFNWVYLNGTDKTMVLADDMTCREYKYVDGELNMNGNKFIAVGDRVEIITTD